MVIFILIFFAMVIAVSVSAVVGFSVYLRRKAKSLETNNQKQFVEPPEGYRSLFEPSDEEVRASEREAQMKFEAERAEAVRRVSSEKSDEARAFEKIWRNEPTRQNTVELLRLSARSESAEVFSQMAENVIQIWRSEQAGDLTAKDLADLLDSHFRTLPQQERTSGAIFWLKQEINRLRGKSDADFS